LVFKKKKNVYRLPSLGGENDRRGKRKRNDRLNTSMTGKKGSRGEKVARNETLVAGLAGQFGKNVRR